MAESLVSRIQNRKRKKKRGGSIVEQATSLGSTVTPESPLGAAGIGADPDQAKMVGTPAAKEANAIRVTEGQTYMEEQIARQSAKATDATPEADTRTQELIQRAAQATMIGPGLATLSQTGLQYALNQLTGKDYDVQVDQTKANEAGVNRADLDALLTETDPAARNAAMGRIAESLGILPENLTTDKLKEFYLGEFSDVEDFISGEVLNDVSAGEVLAGLSDEEIKSRFGVDSIGELSDFIGMDVNDLSIKDLESVATQIRSVYDVPDALISKLSDTTLGPQEREAARKRLEELGYFGAIAQFEQAVDVADQIEAGMTVEFDGREMMLEDVLEDDFLSAEIALALNDEKRLDELKENQPALGEWIESNKDSLSDLITELDEASIAYHDSVKEIQSLKNFGDEEFSDKQMEMLIPGWEPRSGIPPEETSPLYEAITSREFSTDQDRIDVGVAVRQFLDNTNVTQEMKQSFVDMTTDDLERLGFFENPQEITSQVNDWVNTKTELENTEDPEVLFESVFGVDLQSLQDSYEEMLAIDKDLAKREMKPFDKDGDGKVDVFADPEKFLKRMTGGFSQADDLISVIQANKNLEAKVETVKSQTEDIPDLVKVVERKKYAPAAKRASVLIDGSDSLLGRNLIKTVHNATRLDKHYTEVVDTLKEMDKFLADKSDDISNETRTRLEIKLKQAKETLRSQLNQFSVFREPRDKSVWQKSSNARKASDVYVMINRYLKRGE